MNINADSNFISNSADEGGGLHAFDATVNISRDSNFMYNSARDGGGVYALVAVVWRWHFNMLQGRTVFSNNNAPYGGAYDWNINGFIGIYDSTGKNKYPCRVFDSISFFQGQN